MTIQEAIRSKKNFKRADETLFWYSYLITKLHSISIEDILATDWEVEDEKFEVTESELVLMISDAQVNVGIKTSNLIITRLKTGHYK